VLPTHNRRRAYLRHIVGLAISLFLLYLVFRKFAWHDLNTILVTARLSWLVAASGLYLTSFVWRAWRWQIILKSVKILPAGFLYRNLLAGYALNNLLPARSGDFYRAHSLGVHMQISRISALSSILVERIFDGLVLSSILGLLLIIVPRAKWIQLLGITALAIFGSSLGGILWVVRNAEKMRRLTIVCSRVLPHSWAQAIFRVEENFVNGLGMTTSSSSIAQVCGVSLLIWLVEYAVFWCAMWSLRTSWPWEALAVLLVVANLATLIPSGPGYVGTFQYAFLLSLGMFGVKPNVAVAYSLLVQFVFFATVIPVGLTVLALEKKLKQLPASPL